MTLYDFNSELSATIANEVEKLRKSASPASPILFNSPGQQEQQIKAAEAFKAAVTESAPYAAAAVASVSSSSQKRFELLSRNESNIATGALGLCIAAIVGYILYIMYTTSSGGSGGAQHRRNKRKKAASSLLMDKYGGGDEQKNGGGGPYFLNRLENRVAFIDANLDDDEDDDY